MAVVVLMYHHTPVGAPEGFYDVALSTMRAQIGALIDAGAGFVKFSDCDNPKYVNHGVHVALTFDDGHASNAAAFQWLADMGLTPTAFIVRDWSQGDRSYLSGAALADLKAVCELGGHSATHRALTSLAPAELADELAASRDYLADIVGGPVSTMALPGGHGLKRELAAAADAGFTLVGDSRPLPHRRLGLRVHRICVNRTHAVDAPLRWVEAGAARWAVARGRMAATAGARRLLGARLYGALTALAK